MDLQGRVAVVTGAASGIGRALTWELVREGATVAAVDVDDLGVIETVTAARRMGGHATAHVADLSREDKRKSTFSEVRDAHDHIDILINNTEVAQPAGSAEELSMDQIRRLFDTNWWAMLGMTQIYLPELRKRPSAHIVNIASLAALCPVPGRAVYGATMGAVKQFTEGLRLELEGSGIGVTIVYPGAVHRNPTENAPESSVPAVFPLRSGVAPAYAAQRVVQAIRQGRPRMTIGGDARIVDALYRISPTWTAQLLAWALR